MGVGGTAVAVGGTGVEVGGTGVAVGSTGVGVEVRVGVGGTGVGVGVSVGGMGVGVGGTGVAVGHGVIGCTTIGTEVGVEVGVASGVLGGTAVGVGGRGVGVGGTAVGVGGTGVGGTRVGVGGTVVAVGGTRVGVGGSLVGDGATTATGADVGDEVEAGSLFGDPVALAMVGPPETEIMLIAAPYSRPTTSRATMPTKRGTRARTDSWNSSLTAPISDPPLTERSTQSLLSRQHARRETAEARWLPRHHYSPHYSRVALEHPFQGLEEPIGLDLRRVRDPAPSLEQLAVRPTVDSAYG